MTRRGWVVVVGWAVGLMLLAGAPPKSRAGSPGAPETMVRRGPAGGPTWGALLLDAGGERRQPAPVPQRTVPLLRRQRPNTISVGFQGQYGIDRGTSRIADGFDHGPGYAFRFRYMLSPSAALGFSFEHQRYKAIQPPIFVAGDFADSHVVITTVSTEAIFFVHRERDVHPYFLGGIGYATPDVIFSEEQSSRINEGLFAVLGTGFERFFRPRLSLDVTLRGYALVSNSEFTSMAQISAGIHVYPGD
ncbi:MAG TPA: hypothetical protein VF363_12355 [Candidatus Eisenbacteria bacterium]